MAPNDAAILDRVLYAVEDGLLFGNPNLEIVERSAIRKILEEKEFKLMGRTERSYASAIARITGADEIVLANRSRCDWGK